MASAPKVSPHDFRRWLARLLARSRLIHRLIRRLAWIRITLELFEEGGNSAASHQMRWARALEEGSRLTLFLPTPRGMEPEKFAGHFQQCRCLYWRWFLEQGVEREIRTVLDVGCGQGFAGEHFVRQGFTVTGVTGNPDEKSECRRRGIKVVEADFHFLSMPDESFDLVFSSHSLEHSISPLFALLEWTRVLRRGGYMMVVLPMAIEGDWRAAFPDHYDPATDAMDFAATAGEILSPEHVLATCYTHGVPPHIFLLAYRQLTWLFRLAGLELVASGGEEAISATRAELEELEGRRPCDPLRGLNGFFLLRKPGRAGKPLGSQSADPPGIGKNK